MPSVARPAAGYVCTVVAAAMFAVNGTVFTLALHAGVPAPRPTALRCTGAALGLVLVLALGSRRRLRVTARELPFLAVFGVVGVALTQFLYYVAINWLPVGIALNFEMSAPVLIVVSVRLIRREHVRRRLWTALILSVGGLVLVAQVCRGGGSLDPPGVTAGLLAAICLATCYLMGERGTVTGDPVALTCWSFVMAAVFWAAAAPWGQFDPEVLTTRVPISLGSAQVPLWLLVGWIVGFGAMVPFWHSIAALRHLPPAAAGLVATVEPVFASIVAWLWLAQALSVWQVIGGAVVPVGIGLAQTARQLVPMVLPEVAAPLAT